MIIKSRERHWIAYKTAFKIMFSYLRLFILKIFLGEKYFNNEIEALHFKNAKRLKSSILQLRGLFIKVGQLISIMSNAVPIAYGDVLESLQDQTPSTDFEVIKKIIEKQLNNKLSNLFNSFEEKPLASASIGQVHKAILKTGEIVAVKIQFDYIKELSAIDLKIIENLIKIVMKLFKINGLEHVYLQVKQMIEEELNYEHEALVMQQISNNCKDLKGIVIPEVFKDYSTGLVLTTKFYEGLKITNTKEIKKWNIDLDEVSEKLIYVYCEMVLNHGIYHADPHPGNILINKQGDIIILDFGSVATLSEKTPKEIANFVQAIFTKDENNVLKSLRNMGFIAKGKKAEQTALKIIDAITSFIQEGIDVTNLGFEDLNNESIKKLRSDLSIKELTSSIQVPKDFILLDRTIKLLQGVSLKIAPEVSPMKTLKPYLKKLVLKDGGLKEIIINVIKKQASLLISLPEKVDTFLTKANKDNLKIEISNRSHTNKMYAGIQQVLLVVITLFCISFAFLSKINKEYTYEKYFLNVSFIVGAIFFISVWKNRKKK